MADYCSHHHHHHPHNDHSVISEKIILTFVSLKSDVLMLANRLSCKEPVTQPGIFLSTTTRITRTWWVFIDLNVSCFWHFQLGWTYLSGTILFIIDIYCCVKRQRCAYIRAYIHLVSSKYFCCSFIGIQLLIISQTVFSVHHWHE